ncbi:hypothetical protein DPEC_G00215950 [Dallia pectoralis]|uniref:Uncharacterized protein n=1 Tax=Dallia pectoralis TaxID=75939 RepID=A0ACC2G2I4_DALPE|nr:hypothetical protein DPEC_G00215950 [Dallia pectoralis]
MCHWAWLWVHPAPRSTVVLPDSIDFYTTLFPTGYGCWVSLPCTVASVVTVCNQPCSAVDVHRAGTLWSSLTRGGEVSDHTRTPYVDREPLVWSRAGPRRSRFPFRAVK